jgi:pyridoxine 4-dehydrogenase
MFTVLTSSSPENIQGSVNTINNALRGMKHMDLFECARVDPKRPIEEVIKDLAKMIQEGKFSHIGLSECSAQTLRRAHAVCTLNSNIANHVLIMLRQVHPIAMVEIEVSPWSYEEETKKGIILTLTRHILNSQFILFFQLLLPRESLALLSWLIHPWDEDS